jgi:peptide/nickel transport system permease protein
MGNYILKQFIQAILILFGVISVTFALLYVIPGDPAKLILGQRADATSVQTVREELIFQKQQGVTSGNLTFQTGMFQRQFSKNFLQQLYYQYVHSYFPHFLELL